MRAAAIVAAIFRQRCLMLFDAMPLLYDYALL